MSTPVIEHTDTRPTGEGEQTSKTIEIEFQLTFNGAHLKVLANTRTRTRSGLIQCHQINETENISEEEKKHRKRNENENNCLETRSITRVDQKPPLARNWRERERARERENA